MLEKLKLLKKWLILLLTLRKLKLVIVVMEILEEEFKLQVEVYPSSDDDNNIELIETNFQ